jgi:hypothetical protein
LLKQVKAPSLNQVKAPLFNQVKVPLPLNLLKALSETVSIPKLKVVSAKFSNPSANSNLSKPSAQANLSNLP